MADNSLKKQVGFLWAPNWTILYLIIFPLFQHFVIQTLIFWKSEARLSLLSADMRRVSLSQWLSKVHAASNSFWIVLFFSVPVFALYQWITTRLLPIIRSESDNLPIDWGRISITNPEIVSVPEIAIFTGLAFALMGFCCYLLFASHIILYTISDDFVDISHTILTKKKGYDINHMYDVGLDLQFGIYRSMVMALIMPILVKLQSVYLLSDSVNIIQWLASDIIALISDRKVIENTFSYNIPGLHNSLYLAIAAFGIFLAGAVRIYFQFIKISNFGAAIPTRNKVFFIKTIIAIVWLMVSYLSIGIFKGFSLFLIVGLIYSIYIIVNPKIHSSKLRLGQ